MYVFVEKGFFAVRSSKTCVKLSQHSLGENDGAGVCTTGAAGAGATVGVSAALGDGDSDEAVVGTDT
jgi:hypothetical protein